nr:modulator of smoothened protein isoform X2 [Chlorocebus sabaeus]
MSLSGCRYLRHRQHRQPGLDQHRGVCGSTHCGPRATVSNNPWTRPDVHPSPASPGVGHHTVFYHLGNHFIDCHLWFAGGFPLAKRSYKICSMDSIHWNHYEKIIGKTPRLEDSGFLLCKVNSSGSQLPSNKNKETWRSALYTEL